MSGTYFKKMICCPSEQSDVDSPLGGRPLGGIIGRLRRIIKFLQEIVFVLEI